MKKLTIVLAMLFLGLGLNAKTIKTYKFNPSSDGTYAKPTESHDNTHDKHQLNCDGPGDYECKWETDPWGRMVLYNDIEEYVAGQIDAGIMSGIYTTEGVDVSWNANTPTDYFFEITEE